jgi:hypothetical protein
MSASDQGTRERLLGESVFIRVHPWFNESLRLTYPSDKDPLRKANLRCIAKKAPARRPDQTVLRSGAA